MFYVKRTFISRTKPGGQNSPRPLYPLVYFLPTLNKAIKLFQNGVTKI